MQDFIQATIDFENADDDYNAQQYAISHAIRTGRMNPSSWARGKAEQQADQLREALRRSKDVWAQEARLVYGSGPELRLSDPVDAAALINGTMERPKSFNVVARRDARPDACPPGDGSCNHRSVTDCVRSRGL